MMWTTKRADLKRTMDIWTQRIDRLGDFSALGFNPKWTSESDQGLPLSVAKLEPECRFWVRNVIKATLEGMRKIGAKNGHRMVLLDHLVRERQN
jgi:hypothetical protein